MSPADEDSLVPRIGRAIRGRRKEVGLTLTQVAKRAGISVSHLSNIENGLSIASLPLLAKVAGTLEISMADLTRDEGRLIARLGSLPVEEGAWQELSHPDLETRIVAGSFGAGQVLDFPLPVSGRDCFVTVLQGSATVIVDGAEYDLGQGDAIDARGVALVTLRTDADVQLFCSTSPSLRPS